MKLIVDSGSTKAVWCFLSQGVVVYNYQTSGINPFFQTKEEIDLLITSELLPQLPIEIHQIKEVYFYGAGCVSAKNDIVKDIISVHFKSSHIEVYSDLLGAARSLCAKKAGIACIIGTGSNSCFYDGQQIINNVSPLGFILGDEGSGAVLGKLLIGDLLKDMLPTELKEHFFKTYQLTPAQIIDKVYRQPFPNRFLAGLSPFIVNHLHIPAVYSLVLTSFKSFFIRNLMKYDYHQYQAHFVGSVAYYFREVLNIAAEETGISIGKINQSPMDGLLAFHS